MSLEEHVEEIRAGIRAGRFANEASVSQGIVLRLLHALSWPAYDTRIVCPEFALEGRRVDFALCHPAYSTPILPPIPRESCHLFHGKAASDSTPSCHP